MYIGILDIFNEFGGISVVKCFLSLVILIEATVKDAKYK